MVKAMNKEIKAEWVKELRGGRYKQGEGVLRRKDNTFCCLGVLADILKDRLGWDWVIDECDPEKYRAAEGAVYAMPRDAARLAELSAYHECNLTDLNDVEHKSFDWIANYVEERL